MTYSPGKDRVSESPLYVPSQGSGGVFAEWIQGATPKYAKNRGYRSDYFRDTLSRIFVRVTDVDSALFNASVADDHTRTQLLPRVSGDPTGARGYIDYLLQDVNLGFSENIQVSQTLADNYVLYAFGQQPPTASFQGVLINTRQDDQATNMVRLYLEILRATALARRQKAASIKFDSYILTGAMLNLRINLRAAMEVAIPFSFDFIVKRLAIPIYTVGWRPTGVGTPFATDLNAVPVDVRFQTERAVTAVTFHTPNDTEEVDESADPRVLEAPPQAVDGATNVSRVPTPATPAVASGASPETASYTPLGTP